MLVTIVSAGRTGQNKVEHKSKSAGSHIAPQIDPDSIGFSNLWRPVIKYILAAYNASALNNGVDNRTRYQFHVRVTRSS